MRCKRVRADLAIYRDLTPGERNAVDRHVASCAACAALLEIYQRQDRALLSLPAVDPSPRMVDDILAQTVRRPRSRPARLARASASVALAAIVAVVAVLGGTARVAAQSLPGDALYSVKRVMEQARLTMTWDAGARENYLRELDGVRVDEVREVVRQARDVPVSFQGEIERADDGSWVVEGIDVRVADDVWEGGAPQPGSVVVLDAVVADGTVTARRVEVRGAPPPRETPVPSATAVLATATPTTTPGESAAPALTETAELRATRGGSRPPLAPGLRRGMPADSATGIAPRASTPREDADHYPTPAATRRAPSADPSAERPTVRATQGVPTTRAPSETPATSTPSAQVIGPARTRLGSPSATTVLPTPRAPIPRPTGRPPSTRVPTQPAKPTSVPATVQATELPPRRSPTSVPRTPAPTEPPPTRAPTAVFQPTSVPPTTGPTEPAPARSSTAPPPKRAPTEHPPLTRAPAEPPKPTSVPATARPTHPPPTPAPATTPATMPSPRPTDAEPSPPPSTERTPAPPTAAPAPTTKPTQEGIPSKPTPTSAPGPIPGNRL